MTTTEPRQRTAPAKLPRQPKPKRADTARVRRLNHFQKRIDEAPTPALMVVAALDYLRSTFTRARCDQRRLWQVAAQVSKAIVRAAADLEEEDSRRGARR